MKKVLCLMLVILVVAGCSVRNPYTGERQVSKATTASFACSAAGAILGFVTGDGDGALIGAGSGAALCGGIGYYMDRQAEKLREQLEAAGVSVRREADTVVLNMPGDITFGSDQSAVAATFYPVLDAVVLVLEEYEQTRIQVIGHTDSRGEADHNQRLSERRAESVAAYLLSHGLDSQRIVTLGEGESNPPCWQRNRPRARHKSTRRFDHCTAGGIDRD